VQLESYKNAEQVTRALAGAGVSAYADLMSISRRRMLDMSSNVSSRLDLLGLAGARNGGVETMAGTGEQGWSVWQSNSVSQLNRKSELSIGVGGYTANGQSSLMGLERPFGEGRIGLLGAAGTTTSQFSNPATRIISDSWHIGAYASLPVAPFFADIAFIFGNVENDARRTIEFPGYSANALAKFNSDERVLRLGGGLQVMPAQRSIGRQPPETQVASLAAQSVLRGAYSQTPVPGLQMPSPKLRRFSPMQRFSGGALQTTPSQRSTLRQAASSQVLPRAAQSTRVSVYPQAPRMQLPLAGYRTATLPSQTLTGGVMQSATLQEPE
jgi:hypothetical protein